MTTSTETTTTTTTTTDVLIIGAGIAGLTAGNALQQAGLSVQLVDKGRGVGGRLSTRRFANGAWFDHGAQYFTANTPAFETVLKDWEAEGVVHSWFEQLTWFEGDTVTQELPQNPPRKRYIPTGNGMNSLPKHLAKNLTIQTSCRIVRLRSLSPFAQLKKGEQILGMRNGEPQVYTEVHEDLSTANDNEDAPDIESCKKSTHLFPLHTLIP